MVRHRGLGPPRQGRGDPLLPGRHGSAQQHFEEGGAEPVLIAAGVGAVEAAEGATGYTTDESIGRVSVIGAGMKSNPGVAATMFETLAASTINIEMISTSPIRISCVVRGDQVENAVRTVELGQRSPDQGWQDAINNAKKAAAK